MSAGNAGSHGMSPPEGDDPFGYLYRQEGGAQGAPPQAPQQPSYRQVRPVGERSYAGQQGQGYGYPPPHAQPQQNPYYAAPETQPGGGYPGGPGPGGFGEDEPPRRNTLLIGAIAVVTAVVLGVGAAILFSGDDDKVPDDLGQSTPSPSDSPGDQGDDPDPGDEDPGDEEDEEDEEPEFEALEADLATLAPIGGAHLGGGVANARSADGSYVDGLNRENSTIVWTFDFPGEPGTYRLFIGYSVPAQDQTMSLAINTQVRSDPIDFKNWSSEPRERENSWFHTYKDVALTEGENNIYLGCAPGDKCDVFIDKLEVVELGARPEWAPGS